MTYNPMSKEFQDECKKLGITGYELRQIYEKEGKSIERGLYKRTQMYYNLTNTCEKIKDNGIVCGNELVSGKAYIEIDKNRNETGRYICKNCRYDIDYKYRVDSRNNLLKALGGRRTNNLDPISNCAKGDSSQNLACILYEWIDLNKENDNYSRGTPVDCWDQKTGLYYQVQGRCLRIRYTYINIKEEEISHEGWGFGHFEREWMKIYESIVCFCFSKDGKIVERIYKFPKEEIVKRTSISIYKSNMICWYEKYRVISEEELKKANDIWKRIIEMKM